KWLKRGLVGLALVILVGWAAGAWLLHCWTAKSPSLPTEVSILRTQPQQREGKIWLGKSWAGFREGLPVIYLKGSPVEIGYARGVLEREQIHTLENEFITMLHGYVPSDFTLRLLKWYV